MTAVQFRVNKVFDIPSRRGLIAVGTTPTGEPLEIRQLRDQPLHDEVSGSPIHVLGVDHPTPRTLETGETILLVHRDDSAYVQEGRRWTAGEAGPSKTGSASKLVELSGVSRLVVEAVDREPNRPWTVVIGHLEGDALHAGDEIEVEHEQVSAVIRNAQVLTEPDKWAITVDADRASTVRDGDVLTRA